MRETVLCFGAGKSLVGILTEPAPQAAGQSLPAMILLNAGLVHRIGPNRLYVAIARQLAALGFPVLRFDYSGIGDSGRSSDLQSSEERSVQETREAMDCLSKERGAESFVLLGICSGAVRAFNTAYADPRVVGAVLINPQGYDDTLESYVLARRYWRTVLLDPRRWASALLGRANYRLLGARLSGAMSAKATVQPVAQQIRENFRSLDQRGTLLLMVFSATDTGLRYLDLIFGGAREKLSASGRLQVETIPLADHTLTSHHSRKQLQQLVGTWASRLAKDRASSGSIPLEAAHPIAPAA